MLDRLDAESRFAIAMVYDFIDELAEASDEERDHIVTAISDAILLGERFTNFAVDGTNVAVRVEHHINQPTGRVLSLELVSIFPHPADVRRI